MAADLELSAIQPVAVAAPIRRPTLRILGFGSGCAALAWTAGLTWPAVDGGVFSTGTGNGTSPDFTGAMAARARSGICPTIPTPLVEMQYKFEAAFIVDSTKIADKLARLLATVWHFQLPSRIRSIS